MTSDVVQIDELQTAMARIFAAIEDTHGSAVTLGVDHDWRLPVEAAFDLSTVPNVDEDGQISDDLAEMRDGLRQGDDMLAIWHDLAHIIGVLRALEHLSLPEPH